MILVFALSGACRCAEILNLEKRDVVDGGDVFHVALRNTKNKQTRSYVIPSVFYPHVKRYFALRLEKDVSCDSFFLSFVNGSFRKQVL